MGNSNASGRHLYEQVQNNKLGAALLKDDYDLAEEHISELTTLLPASKKTNKTASLLGAMAIFPRCKRVKNDKRFVDRFIWLYKKSVELGKSSELLNIGTRKRFAPLCGVLDDALNVKMYDVIYDIIAESKPETYGAKRSPLFKLTEFAEHTIAKKATTKRKYEMFIEHYPKIATALVKQGFNIDVRGIKGRTPLMSACRTSADSDYKFVKTFIDLGASLSASNAKGKTVLDQAVSTAKRTGTVKLLQVIVDSATPTNNVDFSKMRPKSIYALMNVKAELAARIIEFLKKHGVKFAGYVHSRDGSTGLISTVMEPNPNKDAFIPKLAAIYPDFATDPTLYVTIKRDSGTNASSKYHGMNALQVACASKNDDAVKFLITNGFDTERLTDDGYDAFGVVRQLSTFKLLVELGVKPSTAAKNPFTRIAGRRTEVVESIREYALTLDLFTKEQITADVDPEYRRESPRVEELSDEENSNEEERPRRGRSRSPRGRIDRLLRTISSKRDESSERRQPKREVELEKKVDNLQTKLINNLERENERLRAEVEELKKRLANTQSSTPQKNGWFQ